MRVFMYMVYVLPARSWSWGGGGGKRVGKLEPQIVKG